MRIKIKPDVKKTAFTAIYQGTGEDHGKKYKWKFYRHPKHGWMLEDYEERVLAYFPTASAMANARIIASAPDLLSALGAIVKQAEFSALAFPNAPGRGDLLAIAQVARDAIAKATRKGEG